MSKLIGRKPVEVNISSPQQGHIPVFNETTRLWETIQYKDFFTGSNTFYGDQTISGSLFVSGNVYAKNLQGVVSGAAQLTSSYDFRYVLIGSITETTWDNIASKPGGLVSGSQQLTSSYDTRYIKIGDITETTWDNIENKPGGIISGSSQLDGTTINNLSGSFTGSFTGSFDGLLSGDGSGIYNLVGVGSGINVLSSSVFQGIAGSLNFTGSGIGISFQSSTASIEFKGIATGTGVALDTVNFAQLEQTTALYTWSFYHNLDNSHPVVTVYDENNQVIQPLRIEAMTTSSMDIVFSSPRTGYAVASMGGVSTQGTSKRLEVTTPSNMWAFQHNIGDKYPVFEVFSTNGDVIIPSRIETVDSGLANIYFPYAATGIVVASVGGGLPSISSSYEGYTLQVVDGFAKWQDVVSASVLNSVSASNVLYSNIGNKPTLVSGSSQLTSSYDTRYVLSGSITQTTWDNIASKPGGIVSGSSQVIDIISSLNTYTGSNDTTNSIQNGRLSSLENKSASVDTSISNLNSYTASLKTALSISGQDVTINGNLIIGGTSSVINSETLNISSSIIELNYGGTAVKSGIYTKDASGASLASGSILWDAANDQWIAGISGSESKILLAGGNSVISGSSQLTSSYDNRYVISGSITQTTWDNIASKPDGIISGAAQVTASLDFRYLEVGDDINTMVGYSRLATTGSNSFNGNQTITGSVVITGKLTAAEFHSVVVSSSTIFESGSSKFGDSLDDTHIFTGSVVITGSLSLVNANIDNSRYLHVQNTASTNWVVNHNLEYNYPSVIIYDVNNKVIIPEEIIRVTNNQLTITFASAESGNAHISVGGISTGQADRFLYTQAITASTWTINHGLNYKYVNINVYDDSDEMLLPQHIVATDQNTTTLTFAIPTSGNAIISKGGARVTNGFNDIGNGQYGFSGSLDVTGSIVVTGDVDAQNFNTTSDRRLKTNLEMIDGALDKVEKLNAYTFDWIDEYNNEGIRQIGLISQEVEEVQPELITEREIQVGNVIEKVKLLDYSKVTALLIGAVKELSEKVKQLENKIEE
jgi:hypothetical protein